MCVFAWSFAWCMWVCETVACVYVCFVCCLILFLLCVQVQSLSWCSHSIPLVIYARAFIFFCSVCTCDCFAPVIVLNVVRHVCCFVCTRAIVLFCRVLTSPAPSLNLWLCVFFLVRKKRQTQRNQHRSCLSLYLRYLGPLHSVYGRRLMTHEWNSQMKV